MRPAGIRQLLRHRLLGQVFVNALRDSQLTGGGSARSRDTLAAAIAIMAREGNTGGTTLDPEIEASLQGLLDSIKTNVLSSRAKLPAEEPRLQPVPPPWGPKPRGR